MSQAEKYLTSSNDRLIETVRKWAVGAGVTPPLRANIAIPVPANELNDAAGGHHFGSDYLNGAPEKIVSDITNAPGGLKASGTSLSSDGCFTPPPETFAYKVQKLSFAAIDPLALATNNGVRATGSAIATTAQKTYAVVTRVQNALTNILRMTSSQTNASAGQGAAALLAVAPTPAVEIPVSSVQNPIAEVVVPQVSQNEPALQPQPEQKNLEQKSEPKSENASPLVPLVPMQSLNPITAGFGGGGPAPAAASASTQTSSSISTSTASTSTVPATVVLPFAILSPAENAVFATTSVSFTGTTSPSASVTGSFATTTATLSTSSGQATTTASGAGNWSFTFALQEGTTTVSFISSNNSGESSATTTRTISVDLTPPSAPTLTINECNFSLATSTCLIATTTVTASWNLISDATYYGLAKNGALVATTTSTTATATASDNATTTFAVISYDTAGNFATSTASAVQVMARPFVINEVAWAGTDSSDSDEWIELKNLSGYTLDVSRLAIVATDGSPSIQLTGTVGPATNSGNSDMYLIERASEATTANLLHNPIIAFDRLSDGGEELQLVWGHGSASTTIDATPAVTLCSGWCAGSLASTIGVSIYGTTTAKLSMERKDASADGTLSSNWRNNDTYAIFYSDRAGGTIFGTPGQDNSSGLPTAGWYCNPDTASITSGTRYVPPSIFCNYLSRFIDGQAFRYGGIYRGDVGSSTVVNRHFLGTLYKKQESNPISNPISGEHFFIALWETRIAFNDDISKFDSYFTTASTTSATVTTPPHKNYRVIPWIYGP